MTVLHEKGSRLRRLHHGGQVLDLEERKDLHYLFAIVFSCIPAHFLVSGSVIFQELIMFIEAVHKQDEEKLCLVSFLKRLILEGMHVHGECHLDHSLFLCVLFFIFIVNSHHVTIVIAHVWKPHIVSIGVHV